MLYALFLTVYTETSTTVYVEDYQMTGTDCIAAMEAYNAADPAWSRGNPSCEPDHSSLSAEFTHNGKTYILPPCPTEDSANCYWAAGERGNGQGQSFYDIDGTAYAFEF